MRQKTENAKKRRIRNVAIIFFAVALVLTFFSNTIMNASLPEIKAQYVVSGTITERINGSGIVSADQAEPVYANVSGRLTKLAVQSGDAVEVGDLLCTITPEINDSSEGEGGYDDAYYAALRFYLDEGLSYEKAVASLEQQKSQMAQQVMETYQLSGTSSADVQGAAIRTEQNRLTNLAAYVTVDAYDKLPTVYGSGIAQAVQNKEQAEDAAEQAQKNLTEVQGQLSGSSESQQELIDAAQKAMDKAYSDYEKAYQIYRTAANNGDEETDMLLETSNAAYALYEENVTSYNEAVGQLEKIQRQEAAVSSAEQVAESAADRVENMDKQLAQVLETASIAIQRDQTILALLLLEVGAEEYTYNEDGTVSVYAETAGIIASLNAAAGDAVTTTEPFAELMQPDSTYTVSFSVSAEKAKKVRLGAEATVINADAQAQLKSIRNAVQSGSGKLDEKVLYFSVTGDVTVGQTLALKLNENSQSYDYTVPSGAVSSDNNGDFVLLVQTKSTPLGNRYYARRADVTVLANNGTKAAISGEIAMDSYVICISTKSLQDGDMVRMKETSE